MTGILVRGRKSGQRHTGRTSHNEVGGDESDASNKPRNAKVDQQPPEARKRQRRTALFGLQKDMPLLSP